VIQGHEGRNDARTAEKRRVLDLRCVARQVVAYHSLRRRFEDTGCEALGIEHRNADLMRAGAGPSTLQG
jgi:hypothetical protein